MTDRQNASTSIKVLVRVRPLLPREFSDDESGMSNECLVSMSPQDRSRVQLTVPRTSSYHSQKNKALPRSVGDEEDEVKQYKFDQCVWSFDSNDPHYTDNGQFYQSIGPEVIKDLYQGFNMCLLAYGQTSSGKTYTMMGKRYEDEGLIPLIVRDILRYKERLVGERINCEVRLSYMEIYNEQVKDLLVDDEVSGAAKKCRVREHPIKGPYVENLNEYQINDYDDFQGYLSRGNEHRSTASTSMNDTSSRSHAIITLSLKQTKFTQTDVDDSLGPTSIGDAEEEMISNIKLVDLAGSERLAKTKVFGQQDRMKEGSLINKSLTVLGRCISILSNNSSNPTQKQAVVPYRDSVLSYILKENLSGNSKSFMIFCVSPIDFEESYQTLNYAKQVKKIKTAAKANKVKLTDTVIDWKEIEQSNVSVIDSLKSEVKELTDKLTMLQMNESGPAYESDKFIKLMLYLEKETDKVKFENKYLKQMLMQKNNESMEMQSYIGYMDRELFELAHHNREIESRSKDGPNSDLAESIIQKCNINITITENTLDEFDPSKVF